MNKPDWYTPTDRETLNALKLADKWLYSLNDKALKFTDKGDVCKKTLK